MRLYYYTKIEYALACLEDRRIKVSKYSTVNDPFDLVALSSNKLNDLIGLKKLRARLNKEQRLLCMSKVWREPLMWAHYADNHRGACIGFDVAEDDWAEMDYDPKRLKMTDFEGKKAQDLTDDDLKRIGKIKFKNWRYEKEWRRHIDPKNCKTVGGLEYLPLDKRIVPRVVLFGIRNTLDEETLDRFLNVGKGIKFAHTMTSNLEFAVTISSFNKKVKISGRKQVHFSDRKLDW